MTTQNNGDYGRDVRNFHHPEDDRKLDESYVDQYQEEHDPEQIVNQDEDIVNNEGQDDLDDEFLNALERDDDYPDENYLEEPDEEVNPNDIDDDLNEDYDENDRDINDYATDSLKKDELDVEYDIDKDLEETDPVNSPRHF